MNVSPAEKKLSEAMKEGAAQTLPLRISFVIAPPTKNAEVAACALSAACCAVLPRETWAYCWLFRDEIFPQLNNPIEHPRYGTFDTLENVILFLNDNTSLTREEIADWLAERGY